MAMPDNIDAVKERVCSGGWVAFKTSCYLFPENQNCNFFHAQDFCRSKGAHLVHIDSKAENDFLINHLRSSNDKSFWIGLSDHDVEGQWRWSDDDSAPKFTDWNPGEPDGNEWFRRQDCAISLARVGNKWSDVNCMFRQNRPVCEKYIPTGPVCNSEWKLFEESCYLFPQNLKISFIGAQDFCKSQGGHLVHIDSLAENQFVTDGVNRFYDKDFWLGLNDRQTEGQWRWIDTNSRPTFTNWNPGQPFFVYKEEDCVYSRGDHRNRWYDTTCSSQYRPVCEKHIPYGPVCDSGWTPFEKSCYLFPQHIKLSFTDAQDFCKSEGGHLVHIDSQPENHFIEDEVNRFQDKDFWLGLNDRQTEGQWRWSDTNSPPTFTNWNPGEPFYFFKDEDCVFSRGDHSNRWYDTTCSSQYRPVCEKQMTNGSIFDQGWVEFNGSLYLVPPAYYRRNFSAAEAFCQAGGAYLVNIGSQAENDFIKQQVQTFRDRDFWLGLNDRQIEGQWLWSDTNSPPTFTNWNPGEPFYLFKDEDCVVSYGDQGSRWYDITCFSEFRPVCEKRKPKGGTSDLRWIEFNKSYYLFPSPLYKRNFSEAELFCQKQGGHLVHIDSRTESYFVNKHVQASTDQDYWLGLNDRDTEGQWRWCDTKTPPTFTDWSPGEPMHFLTDEDCVVSLGNHQHKWFDRACASEFVPVCEKQ